MRKYLILALLCPLAAHAQFSTVTCTHGETGTCRQATTAGYYVGTIVVAK